MELHEIAALIFASLIAITAAFQWALAFGAPWGELTMGGKFHGTLPANLRFAAGLQSLLLISLAALVLSRAGIGHAALLPAAAAGTWVAVAISAVALLLNLITPSKRERQLWAPMAAAMLASAITVALA